MVFVSGIFRVIHDLLIRHIRRISTEDLEHSRRVQVVADILGPLVHNSVVDLDRVSVEVDIICHLLIDRRKLMDIIREIGRGHPVPQIKKES